MLNHLNQVNLTNHFNPINHLSHVNHLETFRIETLSLGSETTASVMGKVNLVELQELWSTQLLHKLSQFNNQAAERRPLATKFFSH